VLGKLSVLLDWDQYEVHMELVLEFWSRKWTEILVSIGGVLGRSGWGVHEIARL